MSRSAIATEHSKPAAAVEMPNVFVGSKRAPSSAEVTEALGSSASLWEELVEELKQDGITAEEWKGVYPHKYGWTLRLKRKERNIVYLSPCAGCFRVSFVLSERALDAARRASLAEPVRNALEAATRYPEGYGVRLTVRTAKDLEGIREVASIKMAS